MPSYIRRVILLAAAIGGIGLAFWLKNTLFLMEVKP